MKKALQVQKKSTEAENAKISSFQGAGMIHVRCGMPLTLTQGLAERLVGGGAFEIRSSLVPTVKFAIRSTDTISWKNGRQQANSSADS